MQVIIDVGFTEMTVADVAKVAGVSTALVHYHLVEGRSHHRRRAGRLRRRQGASQLDGHQAGFGRAPPRPRLCGSLPSDPSDGSWLLWIETWGEAPAAVVAGGDGGAHRSRDRSDPPAVQRAPRLASSSAPTRRLPRRGCRRSGRSRHPADTVRRRPVARRVRRRVPRRHLPRARAVAPSTTDCSRSRSDHRPRHPERRAGAAAALSAGAVWSFGTVLARVADGSNAFQYLIWRSLGIIAVVEAWALATGRPQSTLRAFTSGRRVMAANVALLLASIGFVCAVKTTSPANAAFLGATAPLFGVVVARVFLGERIAVAHIHCDGGRARGTGDHGGRRHQCRGRRQGHRRRPRGARLGRRPRSTPRSCARHLNATGRRSCRATGR